MKNWKLGLLVFYLVGTLAAESRATGSYCAVMDRSEDEFLNLRAAPSVSYPVIGKMIPSDLVLIDTGFCREAFGRTFCDKSGRWVFVEKVFSTGTRNDAIGWANSAYLRVVACLDD